jgi:AcrR family transcriptional regulator
VYHRRVSRPYELKLRAERQEQTRRRIVEAAIALHEAVGPARTTITDVARQAGVGRLSVYRHFPDEPALLAACSGLWFERNPVPDLSAWRAIAAFDQRLGRALRDSYAYHRRTQAMIRRVLADVGDQPVMEPYHAYWREAADAVAAGWPAPRGRRALVRAAVGHALAFATWDSLTREQGLSDRRAAALAAGFVAAAE